MSTISYPQTVLQATGGKYATFDSLANIKNNASGKHAITKLIKGKSDSPNRPSTVSCTNFKLNLPTGARVTSVKVEYRHDLQPYNSKYPSINAPTISLLGVSGYSVKGKAPNKTMTTRSLTFTPKKSTDFSSAKLNSNGFGVKIKYPTNANKNSGYLRISFVRITVNYKTPSFTLAYSCNPRQPEQGGKANVTLKCSNKNLTDYTPTITVTTPAGFTLTDVAAFSNSWVKVNNRTYLWKPKFTSKVGSLAVGMAFDVNVTGSLPVSSTFEAVESLTGATGSLTVQVVEETPDDSSEDDDTRKTSYEDDGELPPETVTLVEDEEILYSFQIFEEKLEELKRGYYSKFSDGQQSYEEFWETNFENTSILFASNTSIANLSDNQLLYYKGTASWATWSMHATSISLSNFINSGYNYSIWLKGANSGKDRIWIKLENLRVGTGDFVSYWDFMIIPKEEDLSIPNMSILQPNEEELYRLGDGYNYTLQSNMSMYGYSEYYNNSTTNSLTYVSSSTHVTTKADGGPVSRPAQFTYEFDFKTTSTDARVFLANESLENKNPQNFPRNSISMGTIDGKLAAHMAGDTDVEVIEGDTATLDTYYHMKIEYDGTELSCYVDDTLLGTFSNCKWIKTISEIYSSLFIMETGTVTCKDRLMWYGEGESYVRDWYKNFRLGVFNNPIEENVTRTLDYWTTDETTNTTINIPITIDTETHNTISVTASDIVLTIDETDYTYTNEETKTIPITTNSFIAVATKNTNDTTSYTVEIEDYTKTYNITFNAEENKTEEVIHDSTDYSNLTEEEIFSNAEYWATTTAGLNTFNNVECNFTYEEDYPLYILVTGDYPEGDPSNTPISYLEPCIIEADNYTNRETNGNYPEPILNIINHDGDTASITIPTNETSSPIVIYDLDLDEDYGTDSEIAIRGIGVSVTIDDYNDCVISAQLKSPTGAIGERSVILEDEMLDEENTLTIGGLGDLWNFSTLDIVNLKDWELIVTQQNILTNTETTISAGNVQLIFYVEQITDQKDYCYINGEDLRYYGAFINDIDIPSGLKTDTAFLDIDGTDTNVSYRQNIREKEITIEFEIGDNCDLQTATDSLRQVTQLILNERDSLNRPIPKQIRFSFMPDVYFEYIVENTFDNPIEISSYNIKAKLTVPAGTSYKINSTTTNTIGNVQGLAKVNPTISIKPTGTEIEVSERNSKQKFTIHYTGDTTDQIIVIDTENRKCYAQTDEDSTDRTDITRYVDFNSDWFVLQGAYSFEGTNCFIRTVEYVERW